MYVDDMKLADFYGTTYTHFLQKKTENMLNIKTQ